MKTKEQLNKKTPSKSQHTFGWNFGTFKIMNPKHDQALMWCCTISVLIKFNVYFTEMFDNVIKKSESQKCTKDNFSQVNLRNIRNPKEILRMFA